MRRLLLAAALALLVAGCARDGSEPRRLVVAATHTLEDSGLLDRLVAAFEAADSRYAVHVVVAGSAQALEIASRRDADVVLTHSPEDERDFIEGGYGTTRRIVMESDFVLVGPFEDSAALRGTRDIGVAFKRIADTGRRFVSRGDVSGTHRKEQEIWQDLEIVPSGPWYIQAGVGMAEALRIAAERDAYILSDRPTYMMLRDQLYLDVVSEGDPRLLNTYAVIDVIGADNLTGAGAFITWIIGADAQAIIAEFGKDAVGEPLFRPVR
jgi:tungstate transport system substrate-binding protein